MPLLDLTEKQKLMGNLQEMNCAEGSDVYDSPCCIFLCESEPGWCLAGSWGCICYGSATFRVSSQFFRAFHSCRSFRLPVLNVAHNLYSLHFSWTLKWTLCMSHDFSLIWSNLVPFCLEIFSSKYLLFIVLLWHLWLKECWSQLKVCCDLSGLWHRSEVFHQMAEEDFSSQILLHPTVTSLRKWPAAGTLK